MVSLNHYLVRNFHQITIDDILQEILKHRQKFMLTEYDQQKIEHLILSIENKDIAINQIDGMVTLIKKVFNQEVDFEKLKNLFLSKDGSKKKKLNKNLTQNINCQEYLKRLQDRKNKNYHSLFKNN